MNNISVHVRDNCWTHIISNTENMVSYNARINVRVEVERIIWSNIRNNVRYKQSDLDEYRKANL